MKNWKTTVFGILGAIGVAIIAEFDPLKDPRWLKYIGVVFNAIGIAGIGWSAKDSEKIVKNATNFFKKDKD